MSYAKQVSILGSILCMPMLIASQPANAETYEYTTYSSAPMSRTVRTYTVAPINTTSTRTYVTGTPLIQRTVSSPVVVESRSVESPVVIERNLSTPVYVERRVESPVVIERSTPVVIEQKPVRVHHHHHSDRHLLNFGVFPLVKLKVL